MMVSGQSASCMSKDRSFFCANGAMERDSFSRRSFVLTDVKRISSLPDSMRVRSRMSFISSSRFSPFRSMISRYSLCLPSEMT